MQKAGVLRGIANIVACTPFKRRLDSKKKKNIKSARWANPRTKRFILSYPNQSPTTGLSGTTSCNVPIASSLCRIADLALPFRPLWLT